MAKLVSSLRNFFKTPARPTSPFGATAAPAPARNPPPRPISRAQDYGAGAEPPVPGEPAVQTEPAVAREPRVPVSH